MKVVRGMMNFIFWGGLLSFRSVGGDDGGGVDGQELI